MVLVQTFNPQHYAITYAQNHDYEGFYSEMAVRHAGNYAPYYYTVQIQASHSDENRAIQMLKVARWLRSHAKKDVIILGPRQSQSQMRKRYYYQIILKFKNVRNGHVARNYKIAHKS